MVWSSESLSPHFASTDLEVYLLPRVDWYDVSEMQQRLVFDLGAAPRQRAALILCEHPPIVTIGRAGSRWHVDLEDEERASRRIDLRFTNRGGGCWLQTPGQLAAYAVVPLAQERLGPPQIGLDAYRDALARVMIEVLGEFDVRGTWDDRQGDIVVDGRRIGGIGIAVRDWVAYHGCWLNVCVPPSEFTGIRGRAGSSRRVTSVFRERRLPVRLDAVRESFLRRFFEVLGFRDFYPFHGPPGAMRKKVSHDLSVVGRLSRPGDHRSTD